MQHCLLLLLLLGVELPISDVLQPNAEFSPQENYQLIKCTRASGWVTRFSPNGHIETIFTPAVL